MARNGRKTTSASGTFREIAKKVPQRKKNECLRHISRNRQKSAPTEEKRVPQAHFEKSPKKCPNGRKTCASGTFREIAKKVPQRKKNVCLRHILRNRQKSAPTEEKRVPQALCEKSPKKVPQPTEEKRVPQALCEKSPKKCPRDSTRRKAAAATCTGTS